MLSDICLEDRVIVHFINTTVTKSIFHPHSNNHGMITETEYPKNSLQNHQKIKKDLKKLQCLKKKLNIDHLLLN